MRSKPASQQRPESFHCIHMNFMESVSVIISCIFAFSMVHALVLVSPVVQSMIDYIFIGIDQGSRQNRVFYQRLNGFLTNIGKHLDYNVPISLNHSEDRRLFLFQGSASACSLQPVSAPFSVFFSHCFRVAFVAGDNIDFIKFDGALKNYVRFFFITPSRSWVTIC